MPASLSEAENLLGRLPSSSVTSFPCIRVVVEILWMLARCRRESRPTRWTGCTGTGIIRLDSRENDSPSSNSKYIHSIAQLNRKGVILAMVESNLLLLWFCVFWQKSSKKMRSQNDVVIASDGWRIGDGFRRTEKCSSVWCVSDIWMLDTGYSTVPGTR